MTSFFMIFDIEYDIDIMFDIYLILINDYYLIFIFLIFSNFIPFWTKNIFCIISVLLSFIETLFITQHMVYPGEFCT